MNSTLNHEAFSGACSFPERFALAEFEDSGVLLDLGTGAFYRLNPVASRIGASLSQGKTVSEAASELVESFRLTPDQAARDVAELLAGLQEEVPTLDENPITFEAVTGGFLLRSQGRPLARIDPLGRTLRLEAGPIAKQADVARYLHWAVPHLLVLRRQPVLHASAIEYRDGVLAFAGPSGAGKTSTANAFAAHGARLISEDLLLISVESHSPVVYVNAEAALWRWIAEKASSWATEQHDEIDVSDLLEVLGGPTLPLRRVLFLDRARRQGDRISVERLGSGEALIRLLENTFAELGSRDFWRELFEMNREFVDRLRFAQATAPQGLDLLRGAARRYYSSISTS